MKLFDVSFPRDGICMDSRPYFRTDGVFSYAEDGVTFGAGGEVSFDTYFNSFSSGVYGKYAGVDKVTLELVAEGKYRLEIIRVKSADDSELLFCDEFDGDASASVRLPVCREGFLYFKLCPRTDVKLLGGSWNSEVRARNVRVAIIICTFNRENFVLRNMRSLEDFISRMPMRAIDFLVVDNGKTLGDYKLPSFVKVIPNKNLGGSGGFTRGLMEVADAGVYTHYLLMDDDIALDCNVLYKTVALLRCLKPEYAGATIGGGMLTLDDQCNLYESGGLCDESGLERGQLNLTVADPANLLYNESESRMATLNYTAWWYCCSPVSSIKNFGLPMPFFIKMDDVEYGMRSISQLIVVNGIGVWHESFDYKFSGKLEYYTYRNELVVDALYDIGSRRVWLKKLTRAVMRYTMLQQYNIVDLLFAAYRDFLKGPDFFAKEDGEELNGRISRHGNKYYFKDELKEMYGFKDEDFERPMPKKYVGKKRRVATLNGYLIPRKFYFSEFKKRPRLINVLKSEKVNALMYKVDSAVFYNYHTVSGFVTKLKKHKLFSVFFRLLGVQLKLLFKSNSVKKKYKEKREELTSFESWRKRLKTEPANETDEK